jgi:hypothetical protein
MRNRNGFETTSKEKAGVAEDLACQKAHGHHRIKNINHLMRVRFYFIRALKPTCLEPLRSPVIHGLWQLRPGVSFHRCGV